MSEDTQKCSIIVFSGDMDKVFAAFIIATTAAAMGMETTMFFTFWGLKAIQKGNPTGTGFFGRMLSVMNRGGIDRLFMGSVAESVVSESDKAVLMVPVHDELEPVTA